MNPTMISGAQPREMRPPQGYGYSGNSGYPGAAVHLQHTTVRVAAAPPRDHIVWSLFSFVYGNSLCLGLAALIFSIKSRDRTLVGDVEGARQYASTARGFNIAAAVITCTIVLLFIIAYSVIMSQLHSFRYN